MYSHVPVGHLHINLIFFKDFIYLFLERGEGKESVRYHCVVVSRVPSTGHLACNPGIHPDWESNQQPFGSQAHTQSTELHQPGLIFSFYKNK